MTYRASIQLTKWAKLYKRNLSDAQKQRILELKNQRDELDSLAREVEIAQQTYEATLQNFYESSMESQFNQTSISVLNYAIPPQAPSSPNVTLNMLSALFLGFGLKRQSAAEAAAEIDYVKVKALS